jgi:hypothetical protein
VARTLAHFSWPGLLKPRAVLILVALLSAVSADAQQATIPDTPAGKVFAAWLDSFNSADRGRIDAYQNAYDHKGQSPDFVLAFRSQTGGFDVLAIGGSEPRRIEYLLKERGSSARAIGSMEVSATDPPKYVKGSLRALPPDGEMLGFDIDAPTRERVIAGTIAKLNETYVFPDTAKKMERALRAHQKKGEYDAVTSGDKFAALLTTHMRDVSHDKHLGVTFSPVKLPDFTATPTARQMEENRKRLERGNCAFTKAEILTGNIGYVKLGGFGPADICAPTAAAAMNFLANTDAVIFDLRDNGGGDALMVSYLASYLFDQPTHLNDLWTRSTDATQQFWTQSHLPGKRLGKTPAYVLTSSRTFSAAEEFAYNLKCQKRATIVGETTGGGAHPVRPQKIDDRFFLGVPHARAINPITRTNWEGVGVEPDVKVPEADALATAQKLAAEKIAPMQSGARPVGK